MTREEGVSVEVWTRRWSKQNSQNSPQSLRNLQRYHKQPIFPIYLLHAPRQLIPPARAQLDPHPRKQRTVPLLAQRLSNRIADAGVGYYDELLLVR